MKVGFYSPYLDTFGGGERYILTLASHLSKKEDVRIFWNDNTLKGPLSRFLKIDLSSVKFENNILSQPIPRKSFLTRGYDLLFILSDGSVPVSFAKKNILHFQVPFKSNVSTFEKIKLKKYKFITVNSHFTKKFIDKSYGVNSIVIYPPVDLKQFKLSKKENIILSVGRFGANQLHPKKQDVLIEVFKEVYKKKPLWKLYLIGQARREDQKYLRYLQKISNGFAIKIFDNAPVEKLRDIYSKAAIYWHATGFGEDTLKHPEKMEHFGISTVEASASGAVPLVIAQGGQIEIIKENKNGLLWRTKSELYEKTIELIENKSKLKFLSRNAVINSDRFSKEAFIKNYEKIIY